MIQLAWPWLLVAVIAPLLVAMQKPVSLKAHAALRVPFFDDLPATSPERLNLGRWRQRLALLAWLLLVLAAARPQWVGEAVNVPVTGRDLMLAVDLSESMRAQDQWLDGIRVSRLRAVKQLGGEFVTRRKGDRVGLILFGSKPYVQVPLTFDLTVVQALLGEASISLAGSATAIGDAIGLALKRLRERPANSRVLVLITDGASNAGVLQPLDAALLARANGLRIHTIGVGSPGVPDDPGEGDALDEATLNAVSSITGGRYFRAHSANELAQIYTLLDEQEPVASDDEHLRPVSELYHLPLAAAFVLAVLIALLGMLTGLPGRASRASTSQS